jgi:tRNA 2-thiocytidine biosynthesis protein TtcA
MMREWEEKHPDRQQIMATALSNIHPSHLYDTDLYDFKALKSMIASELSE